MSFAFEADETVAHGVRRMVGKQIEGALEQLSGRAGTARAEAVHDARKRFRKVRALLRLVRGALGNKVYDRENACFRAAARPLSAVRNSEVLVQTLDKLIGQAGGADATEFIPAREAVRAQCAEAYRRIFDEQDAPARVMVVVEAARRRLDDWPVGPDGWSALGPGIERSARRGYLACAEACAAPTVEKLHEWRKRVKDLRHQLEVLAPVWPGALEGLAVQAHRLTELLGDDHDLAVLADLLREQTAGRWGDPPAREALLALIDRRRAELQRTARELGPRVHRDEPEVLAARLGACWRVWRSEARADNCQAAG